MNSNELIPLECTEFEDRLQDLLDQRESLSADAQLWKHTEECSQCKTLFLEYLQLFSNGISEDPFDSGVVKSSKLLKRSANKRSTWQAAKIVWSLTPCFGALLVVLFSILVDRQTNSKFEIATHSPERLSRFQVVVANNQSKIDSPSRLAPSVDHSNDLDEVCGDPFIESFLSGNGLMGSVQNYSNALYEYAYAKTRFPTDELWQLRSENLNRMTEPLVPIQNFIPLPSDLSFVPHLYFYFEFTRELIKRTVSPWMDRSEPDLGFQPEFRMERQPCLI